MYLLFFFFFLFFFNFFLLIFLCCIVFGLFFFILYVVGMMYMKELIGMLFNFKMGFNIFMVLFIVGLDLGLWFKYWKVKVVIVLVFLIEYWFLSFGFIILFSLWGFFKKGFVYFISFRFLAGWFLFMVRFSVSNFKSIILKL